MSQLRPFLTARWVHLAMLNYEGDPALLVQRVPLGRIGKSKAFFVPLPSAACFRQRLLLARGDGGDSWAKQPPAQWRAARCNAAQRRLDRQSRRGTGAWHGLSGAPASERPVGKAERGGISSGISNGIAKHSGMREAAAARTSPTSPHWHGPNRKRTSLGDNGQEQ